MKKLITTLLFCAAVQSYAQTYGIDGTYTQTIGEESADTIKYSLTLESNGTYEFHSYSHNVKGVSPETKSYSKGYWKAEKNTVSFSTDSELEQDGKFPLDFRSAQAQIISKNPKDTLDDATHKRLKFYVSKIKWLPGTELTMQ